MKLFKFNHHLWLGFPMNYVIFRIIEFKIKIFLITLIQSLNIRNNQLILKEY